MVLCPRSASESSASCFKPRIGEYLKGKRAVAYWVKSQRFPVWGYLGPSVLDALVYFQCLQIDVFYFDIFTCSQRQHWCTTTQSITLEHLETQNCLTPDFTCWQVLATGHGLLPWCVVMGWCYVSPKLTFTNAWCLDVGPLGGDQVMRGISALMKENPRVPWPFTPCEDTVRRWLWARKQVLTNAESAGP